MTSRVLLSERRSPSHDQAVSVVLNRAIGPTCPWSPAAGCLLGSDRRSAEKWTEPGRRTFLVPLAAGNGEDGAISLIDPRVRAPGPPVHLDEKSKGHPCRTLVAVEERMVLGQPNQEHGCLVDEVRIEVLSTPAARRRVERRIGQIDVHGAQHDVRLGPGDRAGDGQVVGEVRILDRHLAKRSSSSRSSSMILVSLALNSGLFRRRSTASSKDLLTVSFRLVPSTRARASASAARSSGRRTVMFFVMVSCYHATVSNRRVGGALRHLEIWPWSSTRWPVGKNGDTDVLSPFAP